MSYKTTDMVTCPVCGNKQKMTIWSIVDANVNTQTKRKILNGAFFEFKCKCCGETRLITYNSLYEDDDRRILIYHTPTIIGVAEANRVISERREAVSEQDDYRVRVVTSPNALREKVRIFDMGLDDRIIEVMKALILEELGKQKPIGHVDEILCYVRDDGNMDVDVFGDHTGTMTVKREFYEYVKRKIEKLLNKQYPNPREVGLDMALEFLERNHFQSN